MHIIRATQKGERSDGGVIAKRFPITIVHWTVPVDERSQASARQVDFAGYLINFMQLIRNSTERKGDTRRYTTWRNIQVGIEAGIMQVSGISTIAPSTTGGSSKQPPSNPITQDSSREILRPAPVDTFTSSLAGTGSSPSAIASPLPSSTSLKTNQSAETSAAEVPIRASSSSRQMAFVTSSYSTTVAGKSFAGSIEESWGTFVASVPDPPGASASGSSVQAAENNLNVILNALA